MSGLHRSWDELWYGLCKLPHHASRRRRRPRGYIEQLPSGSYRAVVYAGVDPLTGSRRNLRETASTYDEAAATLTKLQHQVDEDRHPKTAITVRQAIAQWLDVARLSETTRERYEDLIRLYVLPRLGDLQAGKLDAELRERFYARLQRCCELCSGRPPRGHVCRPLSSSTVRKVHYIIRGALERAVPATDSATPATTTCARDCTCRGAIASVKMVQSLCCRPPPRPSGRGGTRSTCSSSSPGRRV
jgi:hypothetical protein